MSCFENVLPILLFLSPAGREFPFCFRGKCFEFIYGAVKRRQTNTTFAIGKRGGGGKVRAKRKHATSKKNRKRKSRHFFSLPYAKGAGG